MTHDNFRIFAISLFLVTMLGACDKPGSAEKAGKQIDQATAGVKEVSNQLVVTQTK